MEGDDKATRSLRGCLYRTVERDRKRSQSGTIAWPSAVSTVLSTVYILSPSGSQGGLSLVCRVSNKGRKPRPCVLRLILARFVMLSYTLPPGLSSPFAYVDCFPRIAVGMLSLPAPAGYEDATDKYHLYEATPCPGHALPFSLSPLSAQNDLQNEPPGAGIQGKHSADRMNTVASRTLE